MPSHPFWFDVYFIKTDCNSHPLFAALDCHIITLFIDTMKLIYVSANERPHTDGCGFAGKLHQSRRSTHFTEAGLNRKKESWHTPIMRSTRHSLVGRYE